MSIRVRILAASPLRFSFPGLQPLFVKHPAVVFIIRPTLFRQGRAIFAPGTCAAAIRNGFPETVRIALEALDGSNKVRYIRHGGAFEFSFSFFKAPIRKFRIRSLRFHWTVCGPGRPAATPSFQIYKTRFEFSPVLSMANQSRNVHRRRASIWWGKIPDWGISLGEPYG
jgi:hypothetical protein